MSPLDKAVGARSAWQWLKRSTFVRDVLWLSGGTGIAQLIALAILPVLSRLYSPADFGLLALYISITLLLSLFASLQYEVAITLSRSHRSASQLVWLILAISICAGGSMLVVVALFRHKIANLIGAPELAAWLWAVPVLLVFGGLYRALTFWKIRLRQFTVISHSMIIRASAFAAIATLMAFIPLANTLKGAGLIIAFSLSEIAKTLVLVLSVRKSDRKLFAPANLRRIKAVGRRHGPISATVSVSHGISLIYERLPHFMITSFFGAGMLGFYTIIERVVGAPSRLISKAISDVYRQRASEQYRKQGQFGELALKVIGASTVISVVPYVAAIIYAPILFSIALGPEWEPAGRYASILLVGEFVAFVITPISCGVLIVNDKRFIFCWALARLLLTLSLIPLLQLGVLDFVGFLWTLVGIRILMVIIEGLGNFMCAKSGRAVTESPYPWARWKAGGKAA